MDKKNEIGMVDLINQEMKELLNNQKQIEELSKDIKGIAADWTASCEYSCDNCPYGSCRGKIATFLVNAGYRKIPENAVVLTEEELDKKIEPFRLEIIALSQELVEISNKLWQTRKETAEKFARLLKENSSSCYATHNGVKVGDTSYTISGSKIDKICKEITEEVK